MLLVMSSLNTNETTNRGPLFEIFGPDNFWNTTNKEQSFMLLVMSSLNTNETTNRGPLFEIFGPEKLSSFGLVLLFLDLIISIINWIYQMQALYTFFRARKVIEFWPCPIVFGLDNINYQLNISNAGFWKFSFSGPGTCRILQVPQIHHLQKYHYTTEFT